MARRRLLAILPNLTATRRRDGKVVLTQRFIQGMDALARHCIGMGS